MKMFVGLVVSLKKTASCFIDEAGATVAHGSTLSEPAALATKLGRWSADIALVGIDACPLSEWFYMGLSDAGLVICCLETRHAQGFLSTRPNKTDRNDAGGIAAMI